MRKTVLKAKEPIKLRQKRIANGCLSLYLDIYTDGRRTYEFLKLYLIPERTPGDKLRNNETLRTANAIKAQRIIELQNNIHGLSNARTRGKIRLVYYVTEIANKCKERNQMGAYYGFTSLIAQIQAYKENAQLAEINRSFLCGFIDHLNTAKSSKKEKPLSPTTKHLLYCRLVSVIKKAVADGLIIADPTRLITANERPSPESKSRVYLTLDEVQKIAEQQTENEAQERVKRAFLFSCFCGLRLCDIRRLRWCDILTGKDGKKQLDITQQKTKEPLYLPLSDNSLHWLPLQETAESPDGDKPIFPLPKTPTIENIIRRISKAAGITKYVTFHVARHTNATLLLTYGVDIYTVSKLLGHTNVRTTQIYAKVIDENKRNAVEKIPEIKI